MRTKVWLILGLLMLLGGCAAGNYQGTYRPEDYPSYSDVPPSYYDYDPTLRHWFTAPYWAPDRVR